MKSRSRILVREMTGNKRLRINWTVIILVTLEFPVTNSRLREKFFSFWTLSICSFCFALLHFRFDLSLETSSQIPTCLSSISKLQYTQYALLRTLQLSPKSFPLSLVINLINLVSPSWSVLIIPFTQFNSYHE